MFTSKYYNTAEIVCIEIQVVFNNGNTAGNVCSLMKWFKSTKQLTMYNKNAVKNNFFIKKNYLVFSLGSYLTIASW